MDDGLKQRLIGAFVLLALIVIFVPVFFDRERIEPVDRQTQIPVAPKIEPIQIDKPVAPAPVEDAKLAKDMFLPDDSKPVTLEVVEAKPVESKPAESKPAELKAKEKKDKPAKTSENSVLNKKGVPNSWVLQIGSFRFEGHAEQFRDKLIADGYTSYVRTIEIGNKKMRRVYVGPKLNKDKLLQDKKKIDKKYNVEAMLLKFKP